MVDDEYVVSNEELRSMIKNEIEQALLQPPRCVVEAGDIESEHFEVFYKGDKVNNCEKLVFIGQNIEIENDLTITEVNTEPKDDTVLNWKQKIKG